MKSPIVPIWGPCTATALALVFTIASDYAKKITDTLGDIPVKEKATKVVSCLKLTARVGLKDGISERRDFHTHHHEISTRPSHSHQCKNTFGLSQ